MAAEVVVQLIELPCEHLEFPTSHSLQRSSRMRVEDRSRSHSDTLCDLLSEQSER